MFGGPEALFADLHRSVRYREGLVEIDKECVRAEVRPSGRGVLLVPSIFAWPDLLAVFEPPWQPTLLYPPRGTARLWIPSPEEPVDALSEALGRGRASALKGLMVPQTTTEIARQAGASPGTVSEHLSRLRKAGLVEPHRQGRAACSTASATRARPCSGCSARPASFSAVLLCHLHDLADSSPVSGGHRHAE
jgi:DNA-binding transcriptional ArsR family regulator